MLTQHRHEIVLEVVVGLRVRRVLDLREAPAELEPERGAHLRIASTAASTRDHEIDFVLEEVGEREVALVTARDHCKELLVQLGVVDDEHFYQCESSLNDGGVREHACLDIGNDELPSLDVVRVLLEGGEQQLHQAQHTRLTKHRVGGTVENQREARVEVRIHPNVDRVCQERCGVEPSGFADLHHFVLLRAGYL